MQFGIQFSAAIALTSVFLSIPAQVSALTPSQVGDFAKKITVRIEGAEDSTGSGFIIEKIGNRYKILTCKHVIDSPQAFTVITPDQKRHKPTQITTKPFGENLDLALVEFNSSEQYQVATVGDSVNVKTGQAAYVAGFPAQGSGQASPFMLFNEGKINAKAENSLRNGYALVYNINTLPGMSGGPVLDNQGHVIGVHGQGAQAEDVTVLLEASDVNPGVVVKSGFNYAIPINTFKQLATKANVQLTQQTAFASPSPQPLSPNPQPKRPTPKPEAPLPKSNPQAIALKGIHDPYALNQEKSENRLRFTQKYQDKIITVKGLVFGMGPMRAPRQNEAKFFLKSSTRKAIVGLPKTVTCEGVPLSEAANLNRHDLLTIQGTYRGPSSLALISDIDLEDCKIISR